MHIIETSFELDFMSIVYLKDDIIASVHMMILCFQD